MSRRKLALAGVREEAVAYLYERACEGRLLTQDDWAHAIHVSGYSRRQLQRLLNERLSGEPAEESGFHVDEDVITAVFLTTGNIAGAHRWLSDEAGRLDLPCTRHFRRVVVSELGTLMLAHASGGSKKARDFKIYLRTEAAPRNHTWELDHTELPIWVVPRGHKQAVRPWLTAVVDRGTRYVLAWVVTFGRPSEAEVRACLVQAMTRRVAPDGETFVGGKPVRTLWDRGLEFLSLNISNSCLDLGVIPVALPAFSPHLKPHVERIWGFIKGDLLPRMPGFTDKVSDVRNHSAIADWCLGEDEFLLKLADWFDWYLTKHVHSSLGCTPLEAWKRDTTHLDFVADAHLWEHFLQAPKQVKVSKNGIRFDTIDFVAPELIGYVGLKVDVRYLPHDRSFIEVFYNGKHVCTAIPNTAMSADQQQALLEHRAAEQRKARARFTTANRIRGGQFESTTHLEKNKKGQMVVVEKTSDETDLFTGGEAALANLLARQPDTGQMVLL